MAVFVQQEERIVSDIRRPPFKAGELESLSKVLGDVSTGSQITNLLTQMGILDTDTRATKWARIYNTLAERQNVTQAGNSVFRYISLALEPSRFVDNRNYYLDVLRKINTILAFHGLRYEEDGCFHIISKANSLLEAEQRASKLKADVLQRNLHKDLLAFCRSELVQENYFHAVLEATKSIASKVRLRTGLTTDGATLINQAFGGDNPVLKINNFQTETEKSEQRGFVNLAIGLFGTFRNPTAHAAKIEWQLTAEDALDLFTLASYVLRRIDKSV